MSLMKYNNSKSLLFFLLLPLVVTGQEIPVSLTWGKPVVYSNVNQDVLQIVGANNDGIYIVRYHRENLRIFIDHYSTDLSLVKSSEQVRIVGVDGKRRAIELFIYFNNKLYITSSSFDKSTKVRKVYVQEIDKSTLTLGAERMLAEMTDESLEIKYKLSQDQSKILMYCSRRGTGKDSHKMELVMFDSNLNILWRKDVTLPFLNHEITTPTVLVTNTGNVCLLGVTDQVKTKKQDKFTKYVYHIFSYTPTSEIYKVIELPDKVLVEMQIALLNDENVVAVGFYAKQAQHKLQGSYYIKLNAQTLEVIVAKEKELDPNISFSELNDIRSKDARYYLDKVILHGSGEITWVAEFASDLIEPEIRTTIDRIHGNILVFHVNSEGDVLWHNIINKSQITRSNHAHSSYMMANFNDNLIFLFNDFILLDPLLRRSASAHICMIDKNGNMFRKKIIDEKEYEVVMRPKVYIPLNNTDIVIFGMDEITHQLAKLTWNK